MSNTTTKVILITGATSGIGRHAAMYLARRGHRVFATGRREAQLSSLQAEAESESLQLTAFRLDVTDQASIDNAVSFIAEATGGVGLDVLVNNAGYGHMGPVELVSDEDCRRQYDTNVFGLLAMIRAFVPSMRTRGQGRIINVSSVGGRVTSPLMGVYNSTKYAVESLSDALRVELAPFGINVSLIEPGPIATEFGQTSMGLIEQYKGQKTPYDALFARADEFGESFEKTAVSPDSVSRAIARATESRFPRARYVAPGWASLMVLFGKALPTRIVDWALGRALGFHRVAANRQLTAG